MRLKESWIDEAERAVCLIVYVFFAHNFIQSFLQYPHVITALYLIDQTILIVFMMTRRRARSISRRGADYLVAAAGTLLPLLAVPGSGQSVAPLEFCIALLLIGIYIHLGAKLSLGRSFGVVPADRGVKLAGFYRVVRHPMYLGYILVHLALLLSGPVVWNALVFGLTWVMLVLRIRAEERILSQNEQYAAYLAATRYRLVPGIY